MRYECGLDQFFRKLFTTKQSTATAIQHQFALPHDILTNNVLPFLALPSYTFEGENNEEGGALKEEQGDDHDFSSDDEEVGNEEYDHDEYDHDEYDYDEYYDYDEHMGVEE